MLLYTDLNVTKLEAELFFRDDATVFDAVVPQLGVNGGLIKSWSFTGAGGVYGAAYTGRYMPAGEGDNKWVTPSVSNYTPAATHFA